jgi:Flp pilus assembly pilin Flp
MRRNVRRWFGDRGAAAVEYAVLLALIAMVSVGGLTYLGTRTDDSIKNPKLTAAVGETTTTTAAADEDEDDDEVTTTTTRPSTTTTTRPPTTTTTRPPTTTTTRPSTTTTTRCRNPRFC